MKITRKNKSLTKKAFTLVELLVVIAIIGILSALIVVAMNGSVTKARIAKAQSYSNSLRNAIMGSFEGDWSLDGTGNDVWNNVTGTLTNTPTAETDCAQNTCYSFAAASSEYVTTPNALGVYSITTNPMTAMIWVKGASQVGKTFFANWDTTTPAYKEAWKIYSTTGGALRVAIADTTTQTNQKDYSALSNIALDSTWHLVGFSWSGGGGTLTLYIDGTAIADGTLTKNTDLAVASINANGTTAYAPITIACDMANNVAANFFNGSLDSARLYAAAVPTSQIKEMYYAGLNKLVAEGQMTQEEYQGRIAGLGSSIASK
ncbi:MAG: LamG-like jellyroll fold domain-containing protein [Candidatus Paceibacterota bacterium]